MLDLIPCPECKQLAEVLDRYELPSTGGGVPHLRTRCVVGCNYNGPEENA